MFDEEEWAPAMLAATTRSTPDLRPLAQMLRADRPIPPGVRDWLAELCDPGKPDYLGARFQVVATQTIHKQGEAIRHREVAVEFARARRSGETAEVAAERIGEAYGMDARTVQRHASTWRKLMERLRGHGRKVVHFPAMDR